MNDNKTKRYNYDYTQLVGNYLMDHFDLDSGIEQKATLKLTNMKYRLPLDIMPFPPRDFKRMAKKLVCYASVIYAAL